MITPSFKKVKDAYYFLENLHDIVTENLDGEYLWPQSLPPIIPEEEKIPVAQFQQDKASEEYRDNLAKNMENIFSFFQEFIITFLLIQIL